PIGVGMYSAAIKKDSLGADGYEEMLATTTLLNSVGAELARDPAVHGRTDVTGFGLLGHGLEMARGSRLKLVIDAAAIPLLARAADLAQRGFVTGASQRNWASYGTEGELPAGLADWQRQLLTDPQPSGGLLVSVAAADGERWRVTSAEGELAARAVVIATGTALAKLGVPGEDRLVGKGVSQCASCDAPLLRNRTTVVVGGGDSGMQEALTLVEHVAK